MYIFSLGTLFNEKALHCNVRIFSLKDVEWEPYRSSLWNKEESLLKQTFLET